MARPAKLFAFIVALAVAGCGGSKSSSGTTTVTGTPDNVFPDGTGIAIASGAGNTGAVGGRDGERCDAQRRSGVRE